VLIGALILFKISRKLNVFLVCAFMLCATLSFARPMHLHLYDHDHAEQHQTVKPVLYQHEALHKQAAHFADAVTHDHSHNLGTVEIECSLLKTLMALFVFALVLLALVPERLRHQKPFSFFTHDHYIRRASAPPLSRAPPQFTF
tara:strand:+ start:253008 stop:253439 length:432 start_codon:yes stop_codon:yes gene_type:complete